jgi:hypothetical protein
MKNKSKTKSYFNLIKNYKILINKKNKFKKSLRQFKNKKKIFNINYKIDSKLLLIKNKNMNKSKKDTTQFINR